MTAAPIRRLRLTCFLGATVVIAVGCAAVPEPRSTRESESAAATAGTARPTATGASSNSASSAAPTLPATPAFASPAPPAKLVAPPHGLDPVAVTSDPLKPFVEDAPAKEDAIVDLWDRMRRGFALPDLDSRIVRQHEQWYATRPDYVQRMAERAGRYLYFILEEVERRGMPSEVALLPFIESAFNPQAFSNAKASGMWQFIPGTGKVYGLKQTIFRDERRDVVESTRAALDYLQKLHAQFGDWQLAFAAYNMGEGGVQRAIDKNRRRGKPTDYASLVLPSETRHYVPKLQAVKNIVADPARFGLALPALENEQYFVTVTRTRDIDVERAAQFAGLSVDEFLELNPSFNKPVILGATQPQILLPRDKAEQFLANLSFSDGPLASYTAYRVPAREKIDTVAARFGISSDELRAINRLPKGVVLTAGSTLLVPRGDGVADVPGALVQNATLGFEPEHASRRIVVKARRGDTVERVARRNGVTAAQLRDWNQLTGNRLASGQRISIFKPIRTRTAKARTSTKTRTAVKHPKPTPTKEARLSTPERPSNAQ